MSGVKTHPNAQCSHQLRYNYTFDAVYCPECLVWLDEHCQNPECAYCATRPDKPFEDGHDASNDDDHPG